MKPSKALTCILLAGAIGLSGCSRPAWEYKTVFAYSGLADSELDKLGIVGWELAGYTRETDSNGQKSVTYVFKRPKKNPDWWKFWK